MMQRSVCTIYRQLRVSMSRKKKLDYSALKRYARMLGFGDIHYKLDNETGLEAIVAIHSTYRGPAIGGCRFHTYDTHGHALLDAIRLAFGMSLKNAVVDLPHGGAKSVIIKPRVVKDREALFRSFGDFVEQLNGRYITAMDVGTRTEDMNTIAQRTSHVIGTTTGKVVQGDPSPFTATGVWRGIQAAVQFKLGRDNVDGLHVALQGGGKVGYHLAKYLHQGGAKITVCDTRPETLDLFQQEFNANVVDLEAIYDVPCDIFSPCALGGTLNLNTINRLSANIIAGCANNQLAHVKYGELLHQKKVLYCPDFLINAGGVIQAASMHDYQDINIANKLVDKLYDRVMDVLVRAQSENKSTHVIAEKIAYERLKQKPAVEPMKA